MQATQIIATILIILVNGVGAIILARFSRLPLTLCVLLWGMLSAYLIPLSGFDTGIRAHNFEHLILYVLIPILVFEAAMSLNVEALKPVLKTTIFASTVGLVIATAVAGVFLYYTFDHPTGFPWIAALLTGIVISATDPVAVVTQLKDAKAPAKLGTLIEGESLFNDASALVLFSILLAMALGESQPSITQGITSLLFVLGGGILVGLIVALLAKCFIPLTCHNANSFVVLSLIIAYGSFYVAEHIFDVSGVISVLTAALLTKKSFHREEKLDESMHHTWESLGFISNLVVFYLMGLVVTYDMFTDQWLAMLLGIAAAFLSRLVSSYFSLGFGKWVLRDKVEWSYAPVMVWGGLRGVITLALVLSLPVELDYWWTIQSIGFGVVLFTLVVQATTNPLLIRKLGFKT